MTATSDKPAGGYYFEDFYVGRRFDHATPRTLTEGDAALYIALTGARCPLHCSRPLAAAMGHRACPLDDFLVFNIAFGKTVPDVSYNALANLGYADVRFLSPVYAGDTLRCQSDVLAKKANSSATSGIVYVRSRAFNQDGSEVLTWVRWVMLAAREGATGKSGKAAVPAQVAAQDFRACVSDVGPLTAEVTGSARLWEDYQPGDRIDHPGGMTVEEADHMLATRLYQNNARVHFDARQAAQGQHGRRLVYGGHVISLCRALSYDGLENAFAVAAIHGGTHANPLFAGDTLYCRHEVVSKDALPGRVDVGALRLRMLGVKNQDLEGLVSPAMGAKHPAVVLDLDYRVLIPRRQNP
ncbi:MAG TPA: MaoC family dehydratase [Usitatibacter sp.]|nr:MaoC family dehydratase [Usitatibacter sp.]